MDWSEVGLSVEARRLLLTKWIGQVWEECWKEEHTDDKVDWSGEGESVRRRRILMAKWIGPVWEEVFEGGEN